LQKVTSLLIDSDQFTRGLIAQMLRGFGMESPIVLESGAQAQKYLTNHCPDICLVEAALPDMTGADLLRWIRCQQKSPYRFAPVIVFSGYTQLRLVAASRDAGANLVVKKPLSPAGLFDRLCWVARSSRPFVETSDFMGPDRRFRDTPPRDGNLKRETDPQTGLENSVSTPQQIDSKTSQG
jgi:CheY-like chemotaxis protein